MIGTKCQQATYATSSLKFVQKINNISDGPFFVGGFDFRALAL